MKNIFIRSITNLSLLLAAVALLPAFANAWGGSEHGANGSGNRSLSGANTSVRSQFVGQKFNSNSSIKLHPVDTKGNSRKVVNVKGANLNGNRVAPNTTTRTANDKSGKNSTDRNDKQQPRPDQDPNKRPRHRRHRAAEVVVVDAVDDAADNATQGAEAAEMETDAETDATSAEAPEAAADADALPDLELLGVSLLDGGNEEELIGPKYRVMIRNNGKVAVTDEFEVTLSAANSDELVDDLPWNAKVVRGIEAGQTLAVDIRLPFESMEMNADEDGEPAAFSHLLVQVDSDDDVEESNKENNDGAVKRTEISAAESVAAR